ncbi:conserved hypothetical protein [Gloeothece citriformis PCC 7424]|uniref:Uncharacterized protein n=1 Tax=Gloeothece citriformis (strain PCC 7424) TaxID=65393 RepID=B7KJS4_GLOC7|nr:hypothetical protein [Gloeothece citriformis]ACK69523.1 conserved hypothetical protein [Gloeothece citriformis PCC 7424]
MTSTTQSKSNTSVNDCNYNLISVLYHLMQGASTYDQYIEDAQQAGDEELADFFRNLKQASNSTAEKGKQLLSQRLQQS